MTPQDITIRPLKRHELIDAARLKVNVVADAWAPEIFWIRRDLTRRTAAFEARRTLPLWRRGRVLGAFHRGELIGVARAICGYYREVSDLWVAKDWRSQGVGTALCHRAEVELRRMGVQTARLYTAAFNTRAIAFYRAQGWRVERLSIHRQAHIRRLRMIKRIQ